MAEQIANEEEKITRKRRGVDEGSSSGVVQKRIKQNEEESEDDSETTEVDVWEQWKKFLDNPQNTNHLMQLSPEKHKIIWCGKTVRRRSPLPQDLYNRLQKEVPLITCHKISSYFVDVTKKIQDSKSYCIMGEALSELQSMSPIDKLLMPEKKFISNMCDNL
ncbi:hypothetical protein BDB00DRAFT_771885 [Zychaea mexicana]|uniref:uncharacterized protein n=1 Tax=Zychaea mexicana TaxID=64656 RepID=UPI0022FEA4BF|nr:uncharacterized protein BDB00DRAFT_771850 [Zychaea mexicana]XP_052975057.1 uncharacterized protein BDB00DRAFT_771885 [Zychaea mexicana]KAI9488789.1 hypothetical protein BDB00DRAFT_771850 [Zychaea mexicana]KAI9488792.1 hypothetical protein BDB00DRAFT_771885 [Zychaea mexicana]